MAALLISSFSEINTDLNLHCKKKNKKRTKLAGLQQRTKSRMDGPLQKRIVSASEQRGRWIKPVWALAPPLASWAPHLISLHQFFSTINIMTTISIHGIVECKAENIFENTLKTLHVPYALAGARADIYQVTKIFLSAGFFFFASLPCRTDNGSKTKVIILLSVNSWLVFIPSCTSESPGSPHPSLGQSPQALWGGAGVDMKQTLHKPLNVLEGTWPYPEWSHGFLAEDTASQETKAFA